MSRREVGTAANQCRMCGRIARLLLVVVLMNVDSGTAAAQTSSGGAPYAEDFADGQAQGWDLEPGWAVKDGVLRGTGGDRARYVGGRWENVNVAFRLLGQEVRFLFRASERGYYVVRFARSAEQLVLDLGKRQRSGSGIDDLGSGAVSLSESGAYRVDVDSRGGEIRVSINGYEAMVATDPEPLPAGTIAFVAPDRGYVMLDDVAVAEAAGGAAPARAAVGGFEGRVFEGASGDTTRPIPGVTISLYGTNDAGTMGTLLQTAKTDSQGRFRISIGLGEATYEFFGIHEEDLSGYRSVDALGPGAAVIDENWIEHLGPLDERTRRGNTFWDRIERPDLMIDAAQCRVVPNTDTLLIIAEIWNVGTAGAAAGIVRAASGDWYGQAPVRALSVRGYEKVEIRMPILDEHRGLTHTFRVEVDPDEAITEVDERNNIFMTGECRVPGLPDLAVGTPSVEILEDARTIRIQATVTNRGESSSPATSVRAESPPWRSEAPLRALNGGGSETVEIRVTISNEERGKEHTFRISVDPEGRIREAGEENNVVQARPLRIPHLPDLVVRSAHAEMLTDARTVNVVAEIGNLGRAAAHAIDVRAASGNWEGTASVAELGAGSSTRVEIRLAIRPEDRGKQHAFRIDVDPQARVPELDEDNNARQTASLQIPELPDLRVKRLSAEILDDAVTLRFTVVVTNDGGASAVGAKVRARSGDWVTPLVNVPPLAVGVDATVTIGLEIPEAERGKSHRFEVAVDPDGEITELDEENNRALLEELFLLPLPDLLIRDLQAGVAKDGRTILITAMLANRGGASASACLVRVTAEDWDTVERTVRALEPGSSDSLRVFMEIKGKHRRKAHQFEVSLDPDHIIVELDDANNVELTDRVSIGRWIPPWWLLVGVVVAILGGVGIPVRHVKKVRRRRVWQGTAIDEELPRSCEPCTRICRRVETQLEIPSRDIAHLTLRVLDPGSDRPLRTTVVRGKGVERLNQAIAASRRGEAVEYLEDLVTPLAESLLREIMKWLRRDAVPRDVTLVGHLRGDRVTYEFTLYHCKRKGAENVWDEEDTWKATVEDERDVPMGSVAGLDPSEVDVPEARVTELTQLIVAFLRKA